MRNSWNSNKGTVVAASEETRFVSTAVHGYPGEHDAGHVVRISVVKCEYVTRLFLPIQPVDHRGELKESFFSISKIATTMSITCLHLTDLVSDIVFIVFLLSEGNVNTTVLLITGVVLCTLARYSIFLQLEVPELARRHIYYPWLQSILGLKVFVYTIYGSQSMMSRLLTIDVCESLLNIPLALIIVSNNTNASAEYAFSIVSLCTTAFLVLIMLADFASGMLMTSPNPYTTWLARPASFLRRYALLILSYFVWAFVLTHESFAVDEHVKTITSTLFVIILTLLTVSRIESKTIKRKHSNYIKYLRTVVWTAYLSTMTYFATDLAGPELIEVLYVTLAVSWLINVLASVLTILFICGVDLFRAYGIDGYDPEVPINCRAIYCFRARSTLRNVVCGWQLAFPDAKNLSDTWTQELTLYRLDNNEVRGSATVDIFMVGDRYNKGLLKDMKRRITCICVADSSLEESVKDQLTSQVELCARYGFEGRLFLYKVNGQNDAGSPMEDFNDDEFKYLRKHVRDIRNGNPNRTMVRANFSWLIVLQLRKPDGAQLVVDAEPEQ